jgi:hypothetical protein
MHLGFASLLEANVDGGTRPALSGSDDQRALIAHVRSALALKTLPPATRHSSMGDGSDLPCVVCDLRVDPKDTECRVGSWGRAHLVCYRI